MLHQFADDRACLISRAIVEHDDFEGDLHGLQNGFNAIADRTLFVSRWDQHRYARWTSLVSLTGLVRFVRLARVRSLAIHEKG